MHNYWLIITVPADDYAKAFELAMKTAELIGGDVLQVEQEPPQGSLIVGDYNY